MARPAKKVTYTKMSKGELAAELPKLARLANDRLRSLEKQGIKTFAYGTAKNYARTQGRSTAKPRFSSGKGMSYDEQDKEYKEIVKFLGSKTSTVSGMTEATKNMVKSFGVQFDITRLNKRQLNRLWKTLSFGQWRDIQEAYGAVSSDEIIESVIKGIRDSMTIRDIKNVFGSIERDLGDESLDWADFDRRFTKYYAQNFEHF